MFQWAGPKRFRPPPINLDDLHIDYVLLSHDHYDHFDSSTAVQIGNRAKWIVPKGMKKTLGSLGVTNVIELSWWESHVISTRGDGTNKNHDNNYVNSGYSDEPFSSPDRDREASPDYPSGGADSDQSTAQQQQHIDVSDGNIEVVFTPTQHWSCRTPFDRCAALWGSFCVLSREQKFFFAGDTAYCSVFKQIGQIYGPFDLAILPIGAYKPRWFLADFHVDPGEALQLHYDLCSKQSVAVHWGTFKLSEERCVEPALELGRVRQNAGETAKTFATMAHGETVKFGDTPRFDYVTLYPQFLKEHIDKNDY
jgi:N-acyl-phosphatidylethanolamine-hydrolysing phospholipase D